MSTHTRPFISDAGDHGGDGGPGHCGTLVSCGLDGTVRLWSLAARRTAVCLRHAVAARPGTTSAAGDSVLSAGLCGGSEAVLFSYGRDACLRLWDLATLPGADLDVPLVRPGDAAAADPVLVIRTDSVSFSGGAFVATRGNLTDNAAATTTTTDDADDDDDQDDRRDNDEAVLGLGGDRMSTPELFAAPSRDPDATDLFDLRSGKRTTTIDWAAAAGKKTGALPFFWLLVIFFWYVSGGCNFVFFCCCIRFLSLFFSL